MLRYTVRLMKKETHPEYRFVVFEDASAEYRFLTRTTMNPDPLVPKLSNHLTFLCLSIQSAF